MEEKYISVQKDEDGVVALKMHEEAAVFPELSELIKETANLSGWSAFETDVFRAITDIFVEKRTLNFPPYRFDLRRPLPLEERAGRLCDISYLEIWKKASGRQIESLAREQAEAVRLSLEKIAGTRVWFCDTLNGDELSVKTYIAHIERWDILSEKDGEIGFIQIPEDGLSFLDYYETIQESMDVYRDS